MGCSSPIPRRMKLRFREIQVTSLARGWSQDLGSGWPHSRARPGLPWRRTFREGCSCGTEEGARPQRLALRVGHPVLPLVGEGGHGKGQKWVFVEGAWIWCISPNSGLSFSCSSVNPSSDRVGEQGKLTIFLDFHNLALCRGRRRSH